MPGEGSSVGLVSMLKCPSQPKEDIKGFTDICEEMSSELLMPLTFAAWVSGRVEKQYFCSQAETPQCFLYLENCILLTTLILIRKP